MSGTDIAFMKPVNASSIWNDDHRAEYLTNGESCTREGTWPAASTNEEDKPWFRIDLQGKFYIRTVVVTPRERKFIKHNYNLNIKNLIKIINMTTILKNLNNNLKKTIVASFQDTKLDLKMWLYITNFHGMLIPDVTGMVKIITQDLTMTVTR